ncbi:MAG: DUF2272 domain-containing protein [Armatimonadetes bacterium]|nr:DUF2272 domain-containing protein [Armatimonadota bacterium]
MPKIQLLDSSGTASAKAKKIAQAAIDQFNKYNGHDEGSSLLKPQIKKYWSEIGFEFESVEVAWSAVFVSWCVVKGGGLNSTQFRPNPAHSVFVYDALNHQRAYEGHRVDAYAPRVGDIIHHNRGGTKHDFDFAKANPNFQSHSCIVIQKGEDANGKFVLTIGGNESDTVGKARWALNPNGTLVQRAKNPIICVLRLTI